MDEYLESCKAYRLVEPTIYISGTQHNRALWFIIWIQLVSISSKESFTRKIFCLTKDLFHLKFINGHLIVWKKRVLKHPRYLSSSLVNENFCISYEAFFGLTTHGDECQWFETCIVQCSIMSSLKHSFRQHFWNESECEWITIAMSYSL